MSTQTVTLMEFLCQKIDYYGKRQTAAETQNLEPTSPYYSMYLEIKLRKKVLFSCLSFAETLDKLVVKENAVLETTQFITELFEQHASTEETKLDYERAFDQMETEACKDSILDFVKCMDSFEDYENEGNQQKLIHLQGYLLRGICMWIHVRQYIRSLKAK